MAKLPSGPLFPLGRAAAAEDPGVRHRRAPGRVGHPAEHPRRRPDHHPRRAAGPGQRRLDLQQRRPLRAQGQQHLRDLAGDHRHPSGSDLPRATLEREAVAPRRKLDGEGPVRVGAGARPPQPHAGAGPRRPAGRKDDPVHRPNTRQRARPPSCARAPPPRSRTSTPATTVAVGGGPPAAGTEPPNGLDGGATRIPRPSCGRPPWRAGAGSPA